jgi:hypothetical protein
MRIHISEMGYGVHPDHIELEFPVIFLHTGSVNMRDPGKKMSLSD